jgi:bifunctional non-homologous end joining protein LigD
MFADFSAAPSRLNDADWAPLLAFGRLGLDGEDLREEPLPARKFRLKKLPGRRGQGRPAVGRLHRRGRARDLDHACRLGPEGIVSKRADSPYRPAEIKSRRHPAVVRVPMLPQFWRDP